MISDAFRGSSISSLKFRTILSPLKLTVESLGTAEIKTGGMVSLGPPDGGMMLAHPVGMLIQNALTSKITRAEAINPFLMQGKLTAFAGKWNEGIVKAF